MVISKPQEAHHLQPHWCDLSLGLSTQLKLLLTEEEFDKTHAQQDLLAKHELPQIFLLVILLYMKILPSAAFSMVLYIQIFKINILKTLKLLPAFNGMDL